VFKSLIDTLARPHPSFAHVALLVAAGIGTAVAGGLTGVGEAYLSTRISQGLAARLRRQLCGRLLDQPVGFFTDRRAGDLLSRINTDIDGVEDVVTDTVFGLVSSVLVTIATLALMLRFSWQLTLAVLVMIPAVALPARRAGRATYKARARTQSLRGQMSGYLQEILGISGIMLVKAFGRESAERQRFAAMNAELRSQEVRENLIGQWFGMLMSTLQTAGPALMILFGGWLVITGRASVGTVFVFATVLGQRPRRLPVLAADGVDLVEGDQHVRAAQQGAAQVIASVGGQLPAGRQAALQRDGVDLKAIIVRAAAIPSE